MKYGLLRHTQYITQLHLPFHVTSSITEERSGKYSEEKYQQKREEREMSPHTSFPILFSSSIHKLFPLTISDVDIHANTAVGLHSVSLHTHS